MVNLQLTSSAFTDGAEIPRKFGYKNGNASPPLTISGIPKGTESLALIMDDPDAMAAVGRVWIHWVMWNIHPTITEIAESTTPSGAREGMTSFGEQGYGGPAPPDKRHTYVFKLYALNSSIDNHITNADSQALEGLMEDYILEQATLTGTYAP